MSVIGNELYYSTFLGIGTTETVGANNVTNADDLMLSDSSHASNFQHSRLLLRLID